MTRSSRQHRTTRRDFLRTLGGLGGAAALAGAADAAPLGTREVRHWDDKTDLLVLGSGAAGIAAALEGRQQGLDVLVVEKFRVPGGTSSLSGGVCYLGGGTPLQKALRFEDSIEAMHAYLIAAGGVHAPREKIDAYCEGSLEQFDWLVAQGVVYARRYSDEKELSHEPASLYYCGSERVHPFNEIARPAPRGHVPAAENQTGGRALMEALLASASRQGVRLRTGVSARRLIVESDGRVVGAAVEEGGQVRYLRARRGVVLATGGFVHNPGMLQLHAPELAACRPHWGRAGDLGDGIRMGLAVGGNVLRMNQGFAVLPLYPPEHVLKGIVVNATGQRFVNEDVYYGEIGHEVVYHQGGRAFLIVDADSDYPAPDYRLVVAAQADTIAALERAIAIPEGALQQTVDYYNRHAAEGRDPLWHKDRAFLAPLQRAPFKAYDLSVENAFIAVHTLGGLQTDLDARVIGAWGEPIPGLYAAGRATAGIPTAPYRSSGTSIGDCIFFGRRAARHAARHAT